VIEFICVHLCASVCICVHLWLKTAALNELPQTTDEQLYRKAIRGLAVLVALVVLFVTRDGLGLSPDSRGYRIAAENLAAGRGPMGVDGDGKPVLQTHLAPGYSAILSSFDKLTGSLMTTARFWNATVAAVNLLLVAWLVRSLSGSVRTALTAMTLCALSLGFLQSHVMLWTEATFLMLLLVSLCLQSRYIAQPTWFALLSIAMATSVAFMFRYAGAGLVLSTGAVVLVLARQTATKRAAHAVVFGVIATAPMIAWLVWSHARTGRYANREAAFHGLNWESISSGLETVARFVLPLGSLPLPGALGSIALVVSVVAGSLIVVLVPRLLWRDCCRPVGLLPVWSFLIGYPLFLLTSVMFFDAHTPLDLRILLPVHVALIVVGCVALSDPSWRRVATVIVVLQLIQAGAWAWTVRDWGLGFASTWWNQSRTMAFVNQLPPGTILYSNGHDAIEVVTGRHAKPIPRVTNPATRQHIIARDYGRDLSGLRLHLGTQGGYVVFFERSARTRTYLASPERLQEHLGLEQVQDIEGDGAVYRSTEKTRQLSEAYREFDLRTAGKVSSDETEEEAAR
jgi:hypothetical protein